MFEPGAKRFEPVATTSAHVWHGAPGYATVTMVLNLSLSPRSLNLLPKLLAIEFEPVATYSGDRFKPVATRARTRSKFNLKPNLGLRVNLLTKPYSHSVESLVKGLAKSNPEKTVTSIQSKPEGREGA